MRQNLYHRSVASLVSNILPGENRRKQLLLRMAAHSPEETLESIAKDARRSSAVDVLERIQSIRQSLSDAEFQRIATPLGMNPVYPLPITFWIQLHSGGMPYLRVWAGMRSGVCSFSAFSRDTIRKVLSAKRDFLKQIPEAEIHIARISSKGRVYGLSVGGECRLFIPFSETQRQRYESEADRSHEMNGARVRFALQNMLHEIIGPLGIELPVDPSRSASLIRDASPLDAPIIRRR